MTNITNENEVDRLRQPFLKLKNQNANWAQTHGRLLLKTLFIIIYAIK